MKAIRFLSIPLIAGLTLLCVPGTEAVATEFLLSNLGLVEQLTRDAVREVADDLELPSGDPISIVSTDWHEGNEFVKRLLAQELAERGNEVVILTSQAEVQGEADAGNVESVVTSQGGNTAAGGSRPSQGGNRGPGAANSGGAGPAADSESAEEGETLEPADVILPKSSLPEGTILDLELLEFGVQYSEAKRRFLVGTIEFTRVAGVYLQVSVLEGPEGQVKKVSTSEHHHWDRVSGRQRTLAEGASYPFQDPTLDPPKLSNYIEPAVVVAVIGSLIYLFYTNQN